MCLVALGATVSATENVELKQQDANSTLNVNEEMHLITKSLEDLLGELAVIKQEANGRLSTVKNRVSASSDPEQIRQVKVSRFVLRRVAELESESLSMRDELNKLFKLRLKQNQLRAYPGQEKQDDADFDEQPNSGSAAVTSSALGKPAGMQAAQETTTLKPSEQEEAAKIGFDLEALKKLGEEIGKRLDQFGKDAAKNLSDLLEGVKLVFREPNSSGASNSNNSSSSSSGSKGSKGNNQLLKLSNTSSSNVNLLRANLTISQADNIA